MKLHSYFLYLFPLFLSLLCASNQLFSMDNRFYYHPTPSTRELDHVAIPCSPCVSSLIHHLSQRIDSLEKIIHKSCDNQTLKEQKALDSLTSIKQPQPHTQRIYHCPRLGCTFSCTHSEILKDHLQIHDTTKSFHCPFEGCNYACNVHLYADFHKQKHTGKNPYICVVKGCNEAYPSYEHLKEHLATHSDNKPYKYLSKKKGPAKIKSKIKPNFQNDATITERYQQKEDKHPIPLLLSSMDSCYEETDYASLSTGNQKPFEEYYQEKPPPLESHHEDSYSELLDMFLNTDQ